MNDPASTSASNNKNSSHAPLQQRNKDAHSDDDSANEPLLASINHPKEHDRKSSHHHHSKDPAYMMDKLSLKDAGGAEDGVLTGKLKQRNDANTAASSALRKMQHDLGGGGALVGSPHKHRKPAGGQSQNGRMDSAVPGTTEIGITLRPGKVDVMKQGPSAQNDMLAGGDDEDDEEEEEEEEEEEVAEEDEEDSSEISASDEDGSWIAWFCSLRGNEFFCEIDEDYIQDDFNLTGLNIIVPYYEYALDMLLDVEPPLDAPLTEEQSEIVESAAEMLYGLIHARYIVTNRGMHAMYEKYRAAAFGRCPHVYCQGQPVLPVGLSDLPRSYTVNVFCPRCHGLFFPKSTRQANIDGAYFGTTFPHLYLMTHPDMVPPKPTLSYIPRVYGFKINQSSLYYKNHNEAVQENQSRPRRLKNRSNRGNNK